jgi:hypothetical protein
MIKTEKVPGWAVGVAVVVVVVGIGAATFFISKRLKESKERGESKEEKKDIKNDLDKLNKQGVKPSFPDSQFQTWSNTLREAFDGCGTTEKVVENVFSQLKNDADYLKLMETYGIRKFDNCGYGTGDFEGTLSQAIVNEMDDSDRQTLNNLLKKNKITYFLP